MVTVTRKTAMAIKSYHSQAELLIKDYILSDPIIPYTSIIGGILVFKLVNKICPFILHFSSLIEVCVYTL